MLSDKSPTAFLAYELKVKTLRKFSYMRILYTFFPLTVCHGINEKLLCKKTASKRVIFLNKNKKIKKKS